MKWKKLSHIYSCSSTHEDLVSHASNPLAVHLNDDTYRVFFSGRDTENKSSVGYVDIDILSHRIAQTENSPLITHGTDDSFYSHGISIGTCYSVNNISYILFMAWQIPPGEHWKGVIGRLQLSQNRNILSIDPNAPFFSLDSEDPISLSYPWVIFDNNIYRMWYGSTLSWSSENGEMIHVIKYATSKDGMHWEKHGQAIPHVLGQYQAFSRPSVIKDASGYHMWYSYRGAPPTKYRIGYSFSNDGVNWEIRHKEVGITVSERGWDSEMICYPCVFDHLGSRYMLYNGNDYGKYGFGLAKLEQI